LIGRDDTLIAKYGLTAAGLWHTTEKVIRGNNDGLPIEDSSIAGRPSAPRPIPTLRGVLAPAQ
jgi:hypothetical protein